MYAVNMSNPLCKLKIKLKGNFLIDFQAQQYQQHTQVPHPGNNFMAPNQRNSPGAFPQSILPKPSQDPMYSQQYSGSPKANGPHPVMVSK